MSSPPRVLLACDFLLKYATGLADGLLAAGADVHLLTRDHGLEFGGDPAEARRRTAERLGDDARATFLPGRVRERAALPAALAARRRARRFAPQVVHLQERVVNDPRLLVAAGVRPGRYALTVHDPVRHPGDAPRGLAGRTADAALVRGARVLFVHGEALRDELAGVARPRAPIEVVPHGADPPEMRPLPAVPTVLLFGRLSHYKGIDVLLDAMALVWRTVPRARVVIAGQGVLPEHPALGDERVVVRSGHLPEEAVPGLFAEATCVALPYRQASQSGVGSLAKTYGRASVVTRLGGLPELVADGSGLVVDPEDAEGLGGALARVLADPGLAERLGRRAADGSAGGASWRRVAELSLDAYRRHGLLRP